MKRGYIFLCMLIAASTTLFAQVQFSLDGHLSSDFSNVAPTIGFEVNLDKIDILANASFLISTQERTDKDYQTFNTDNTLEESRFKILAGVAPKAIVTDKISLTFPLLVKVSFGTDSLKFDSSNVYSSGSVESADYLGYGLDAGARAYFNLNQNWDIYAGFLFDVFSLDTDEYTYWKTSPTSTYTIKYETTTWFSDGELQLGVRFKF